MAHPSRLNLPHSLDPSSRIGIALGGGGARGAAHIGVLRHLEAIRAPITCISGTSAGAIVAALWAFGLSLDQISAELRALKPADLAGFNWRGGLGLFHNHSLEQLLERLLPPQAQIQDAQVRLAIVATDLLTGKRVCLTHGPVVAAVLASSAVPGFYTPVATDGMLLADGGMTENVPVTVLKRLGAGLTIGVSLNGQEGYGDPTGILDVVSTALSIAIDSRTFDQLKQADQVIALDLSRYPRTNALFFDEVVEAGYTAAAAAIPSIGALSRTARWKRLWKAWLDALPVKWPELLRPRRVRAFLGLPGRTPREGERPDPTADGV